MTTYGFPRPLLASREVWYGGVKIYMWCRCGLIAAGGTLDDNDGALTVLHTVVADSAQ